MSLTIELVDITVGDRVRKVYAHVDSLMNSIKRYGLLQPIVIGTDNGKPVLIAGGCRLEALRRLGMRTLTHVEPGIRGEFLWQGEDVPEGDERKLMFAAMELEENIKRAPLTWSEELFAKQRLLSLMQSIYGQPKVGPVNAISSKPGFGVNKLAAMLGESPATTSQDLKVAEMIQAVPALRAAKNKSEILSKMKIGTTILGMQALAVTNAMMMGTAGNSIADKESYWFLFEQDFRTNQIKSESVDLVWTDLPYGSDVTAAHDKTGVYHEYDDSRESLIAMLGAVARESYRVLAQDRYAVFCFGFNYYTELCEMLKLVGFEVNPVPCVWVKGTKFSVNPLMNYCLGYEPILVARKGSPHFIRPGQSNVMNFAPPVGRIHLVQKPVALIEQFITDMTTEGSTVVDWCAGTGSTGEACHRLKRKALLFERDSVMIELAKARLGALA